VTHYPWYIHRCPFFCAGQHSKERTINSGLQLLRLLGGTRRFQAGLLSLQAWLVCVLNAFRCRSADSRRAAGSSLFNLDLETAAQLRPQLVAHSMEATGRYAIGRLGSTALSNSCLD